MRSLTKKRRPPAARMPSPSDLEIFEKVKVLLKMHDITCHVTFTYGHSRSYMPFTLRYMPVLGVPYLRRNTKERRYQTAENLLLGAHRVIKEFHPLG